MGVVVASGGVSDGLTSRAEGRCAPMRWEFSKRSFSELIGTPVNQVKSVTMPSIRDKPCCNEFLTQCQPPEKQCSSLNSNQGHPARENLD